MQLISLLNKLICPAFSRQHTYILELQKSLQETFEHNKELLHLAKALRNELQFIYAIHIHRQGCRFRLLPMLQQELLLLAVEYNASQVNFYLYAPNQQSNEIAQAYTNVQDNVLIIHELYVSPSHSNPQIHSLLLLQIKAEAKTLALSVIYAYQPDAI